MLRKPGSPYVVSNFNFLIFFIPGGLYFFGFHIKKNPTIGFVFFFSFFLTKKSQFDSENKKSDIHFSIPKKHPFGIAI